MKRHPQQFASKPQTQLSLLGTLAAELSRLILGKSEAKARQFIDAILVSEDPDICQTRDVRAVS